MDLLCSAVDHSCPVSRQVDNLQEGIDSGSKGYLDKRRTGVCALLVHFALFGGALVSELAEPRESCSSSTGFRAWRGSCSFPAHVHLHLQPLCAGSTSQPGAGSAWGFCSGTYSTLLWPAKDNAMG